MTLFFYLMQGKPFVCAANKKIGNMKGQNLSAPLCIKPESSERLKMAQEKVETCSVAISR
jgi:hypothetical protein